MTSRRVRRTLLTVPVIVVADLAVAQLLKATWPPWYGPDAGESIHVASADLHHELAPNQNVMRRWGRRQYSVRTNSLGLRDSVVRDVPDHASHPRLVVIGDSFTFGSGLGFEDTFVGRLAAELESQGTEVLNAGVESYAPSLYFAKARRLLEQDGVTFDALAVFIDVSDIEDEAISYTLDDQLQLQLIEAHPFGQAPVRSLDVLKDALKNNSVIIHFADAVKDAIAFQRLCPTPLDCMIGRTRARWTVDDELYAAYGRKGLARAERAMNALFELTQRHRVKLLVAAYPWPDQIVERDLSSRQAEFWRQWCEQRDVPFLDLFPLFINGQPPEAVIEDYFIPYDIHWNAAGHKLVAAAALDWLQSSEIFPR